LQAKVDKDKMKGMTADQKDKYLAQVNNEYKTLKTKEERLAWQRRVFGECY
jgi:hypothetical protein